MLEFIEGPKDVYKETADYYRIQKDVRNTYWRIKSRNNPHQRLKYIGGVFKSVEKAAAACGRSSEDEFIVRHFLKLRQEGAGYWKTDDGRFEAEMQYNKTWAITRHYPNGISRQGKKRFRTLEKAKEHISKRAKTSLIKINAKRRGAGRPPKESGTLNAKWTFRLATDDLEKLKGYAKFYQTSVNQVLIDFIRDGCEIPELPA